MIKEIVNKMPSSPGECPHSILNLSSGSYICSRSKTEIEGCIPEKCNKLKPITEYLRKNAGKSRN